MLFSHLFTPLYTSYSIQERLAAEILMIKQIHH